MLSISTVLHSNYLQNHLSCHGIFPSTPEMVFSSTHLSAGACGWWRRRWWAGQRRAAVLPGRSPAAGRSGCGSQGWWRLSRCAPGQHLDLSAQKKGIQGNNCDWHSKQSIFAGGSIRGTEKHVQWPLHIPVLLPAYQSVALVYSGEQIQQEATTDNLELLWGSTALFWVPCNTHTPHHFGSRQLKYEAATPSQGL